MNFNWFKSIVKSFYFAFQGIRDVIKRERNFRIHIVAVYYVSLFAILYKLTNVEYAILFLTYFIVLALEIVNTAVEAVIDLNIYEKNEYARLAKDAAAAGVLIAAVCSVIVAVFLFGNPDKLGSTVSMIVSTPLILVFVLPLLPAVLFVKGSKNWEKLSKKGKDK